VPGSGASQSGGGNLSQPGAGLPSAGSRRGLQASLDLGQGGQHEHGPAPSYYLIGAPWDCRGHGHGKCKRGCGRVLRGEAKGCGRVERQAGGLNPQHHRPAVVNHATAEACLAKLDVLQRL
jgi:hypothetical protein